MTLTLGEYCAGTGGFSIAFKNCKPVYANDFEKSSKILFEYNFPSTIFYQESIHELNMENIPYTDIITCGFSCQPFSIAGLRKGFEDKRSLVFFKVIEIIRHIKPQCIVFENVKHLLSHNNGNTLHSILLEIEGIGYFVKYKVLNTKTHSNIPQNRERIFIVGFRSLYQCEEFVFPEEEKCINNFEHYLELDINEKYYYSTKYKIWERIKDTIIKPNTIYQYRRGIVRENKSGVCPTLTATMGTGGHNVPLILDKKGIRKLTPRECFNFQGFPSEYMLPSILSDNKLYKLAGNAITIPVVEKIAQNIETILNK